MIPINPREIAAEAFMQIMTEGAYNHMALRRVLKQNGAMSVQNRAFVTEIVNGTLRNLYLIDYHINAVSKTKIEKMKPWILAVLRTAVYQILFLDVPDHAACDEAVKLAGTRGYRALSKFVNGVLRTIIRTKQEIVLPQEGTAEYLHILYSHPLWLVKMWIAYYGYAQTELLCKANNDAPDVTIRVNTQRIQEKDLIQKLEDVGVVVTKGNLWDNALHLRHTADLRKLDLFTEGYFHVQDESSQTAAAVVAPQKGERILDLCAAPGGKSFTMAELMEDTGEMVSCDIYPQKVIQIQEGAARLGLQSIQAKERDACKAVETEFMYYDRVLADVPCSGLGLLRKKPDIRLKKDGSEIDALVPIQKEILTQAAKYVKPGGVLVYSTCTLCRKENEKNIEWFLQQHTDFVLDDFSDLVTSELKEQAKTGMLTLFPHQHHTDGFFIARFRKKGGQD